MNNTITATQTYMGSAGYANSVASYPSNVPIPVLPVPNPLYDPAFLSGISQCSDSIWLGSLVPGSTVQIYQIVAGVKNILATAVVVQPTQWVPLSFAPRPDNPVLATQSFANLVSPVGQSWPVLRKNLSAANLGLITEPIRDCQTFLDMSFMAIGADVKITNVGATETITLWATSPWNSYTLVDIPPLLKGSLEFEQYFTRCEGLPPLKSQSFPVVDKPLTSPVVNYALCETESQFTVSRLLSGEILSLYRVVTTNDVPRPPIAIGAQGVSCSTATVHLPLDFLWTDPNGTVSIWIFLTLCDQTLPPVKPGGRPGHTSVSVSTGPGPTSPPTVQPPLYQCATGVTVNNAYPGSLIQVYSGNPSDGNTLTWRSQPRVATTADLVVPSWGQLATDEQIYVTQSGCGANFISNPAVPVLASPDPPNPPAIVQPVLSDATEVDVTGVLPGATVYLSVDGIYRSHVTSFEASPRRSSTTLLRLS